MDLNEIITKKDLKEFKRQILDSLSEKLKNEFQSNFPKRWIRAKELQKITGWSLSTIQTYRANGTLTYSKVGGTVFYDAQALSNKLEENSKNNRHEKN